MHQRYCPCPIQTARGRRIDGDTCCPISSPGPGAVPESIRITRGACPTVWITSDVPNECPAMQSGTYKARTQVPVAGKSYVDIGNSASSLTTQRRSAAAIYSSQSMFNPATRFSKYFPPAPLPYVCPERIPSNEPMISLMPCMPLLRYRGSAETAAVAVVPTIALSRRIALRSMKPTAVPNFPSTLSARAMLRSASPTSRPAVRASRFVPQQDRFDDFASQYIYESFTEIDENIPLEFSTIAVHADTHASKSSTIDSQALRMRGVGNQRIRVKISDVNANDPLHLRYAMRWGAPPNGEDLTGTRRTRSALPVFRMPPRKPRMGEKQYYMGGEDPFSLYLSGKFPPANDKKKNLNIER